MIIFHYMALVYNVAAPHLMQVLRVLVAHPLPHGQLTAIRIQLC